MSSVVNILAGILMGPVYALVMATVTALSVSTQAFRPWLLTERATLGATLAGLFLSTVENFIILPRRDFGNRIIGSIVSILSWFSLQICGPSS